MPTNNQGGLEVQFPGGTRIAVTPSFWEHHQLHYMNINVYHGRATEGIMGAIAPNNWLPNLSNGDFRGPRPDSRAQRRHDLYETFADSWRVNETTSLFYYEPGLTPAAFIVPGWPVSEAQSCLAPPQPGVPVPTATTTPHDWTSASRTTLQRSCRCSTQGKLHSGCDRNGRPHFC